MWYDCPAEGCEDNDCPYLEPDGTCGLIGETEDEDHFRRVCEGGFDFLDLGKTIF